MMGDDLAKNIIERFGQLRAIRQPWEGDWRDIATYIVPERNFTPEGASSPQPRRRIYDSTAPSSNERLAAAIAGLLVNPALKWFGLGTDDDVDGDEEVRGWFDFVRDSMFRVFNRPDLKFYISINEFLQDAASFGTAAMYHRKMPDGSTYYQTLPLSTVFIDEDSYGRVNVLYRRFELTAPQAVDMFGLDRLPEAVVKIYKEGKNIAQKHSYIQAVYPRERRDHSRLDARNKKYASVVVHESSKSTIVESGFDTFPFSVARWMKSAGERYGTGPGKKVLPEIMMVNAMSKTMIEAAQKIADPPLMMPDDGFMLPLRTHPGGVNFYRSGTQERIEPLYNGARPDINVEIIEQRRAVIRDAHFLDMLDLPLLDRMTATEVMQRQSNKMQLFSPILSRLTAELLDPIIFNTFNYLAKSNALPPAPEALAGKNLRVTYLSPLALSQKSSEAVNVQRYMEFITPMAQVDPTVLDSIHPQRFAELGKSMFNTPQRMFRTDAEVAEKQQRDRDFAEAAQQAEIAKTTAEAAKAGSEALTGLRQ